MFVLIVFVFPDCYCFKEIRRNRCWDYKLQDFGFKTNERQFDGICLLGPDKEQRIQLHDCDIPYQVGDFGFHSHAPNPKCQKLEVVSSELPAEMRRKYIY